MQKMKNKIPVRHACADPDNSNGGGVGGGSNCFSREVRTSFSSRKQMSRSMGFPTMWYVRPAKPQISLRACAYAQSGQSFASRLSIL